MLQKCWVWDIWSWYSVQIKSICRKKITHQYKTLTNNQELMFSLKESFIMQVSLRYSLIFIVTNEYYSIRKCTVNSRYTAFLNWIFNFLYTLTYISIFKPRKQVLKHNKNMSFKMRFEISTYLICFSFDTKS